MLICYLLCHLISFTFFWGHLLVQHPPLHASQLICGDKLQVGLDLPVTTSFGLDPLSGNLAARNCSWARVLNNVVWYEVDAVAGACGNILRVGLV